MRSVGLKVLKNKLSEYVLWTRIHSRKLAATARAVIPRSEATRNPQL
jgi:hypothetical protein